MKTIVLAILMLSSCSSWKKKDFEKELDKQPDAAVPQVEVKDEKLKEKFEVKSVEVETPKPAEAPAPVTGKNKKSKSSKKSSKVEAPQASVPKPAEAAKKIPADYPEELVKLNEKGKKVWSLYKSNHPVNEKVYLDIHYLGMTVGKIMVVNNGRKMINGKEVWHFHSRFKSAPFYSSIYELDDTVDTYVTTDQFLSIRYSLVQRESKQNIDDLQLHDRDQLKSFWFYKSKKPDGDEKKKEVEAYFPYFSIDPFSVVFFYQGLPLQDGEVYEIPIINKGKMLVLTSRVEGREKIETELGTKKAIRVHATTQYTGETLKSGDLYFWFSDDEKRVLLKAQAKIKIGSVTADVVK